MVEKLVMPINMQYLYANAYKFFIWVKNIIIIQR